MATTYVVAIGQPGADDRCIEHPRPGEQLSKLDRAWPVHRVDRVAMKRVAVWDRNKGKTAARQDLQAMARQLIRQRDVFQQIAAQQRARAERTQLCQIRGIGQIGTHIDSRRIAHVDMYDVDAAGTQRTKQLLLGPWLRLLAELRRAAAQIEQWRKPLGLKAIERGSQPAGFGFEHPALDRASESPTMPNRAAARKRGRRVGERIRAYR